MTFRDGTSPVFITPGDHYYKVVSRKFKSPETVHKLFWDKEIAEFFMADLDESNTIDGVLWLVEVAPDGTEKDVYGYT